MNERHGVSRSGNFNLGRNGVAEHREKRSGVGGHAVCEEQERDVPTRSTMPIQIVPKDAPTDKLKMFFVAVRRHTRVGTLPSPRLSHSILQRVAEPMLCQRVTRQQRCGATGSCLETTHVRRLQASFHPKDSNCW
jgi:hypothetical protein